MQLDLTDDDMFVVQPRNTLPKNQHPQSPGEAMMQAQLSSPFARQPTPRLATTPQMPAIPSHATSDARRLSAVGALPAPLALAIRQLELQPQAMPCSVSCGTGGCWAALDGALHVDVRAAGLPQAHLAAAIGDGARGARLRGPAGRR